MYDGFTWAATLAGNVVLLAFLFNLGRAWMQGKSGYYNGSQQFPLVSDSHATPQMFNVAFPPAKEHPEKLDQLDEA